MRVGRRQKRILQVAFEAMAKNRRRWFCRSDLRRGLSKFIVEEGKGNPLEMEKIEARYMEAFYRLRKAALIAPVALLLDLGGEGDSGFTFKGEIRRKGHEFWVLTEKGHKVIIEEVRRKERRRIEEERKKRLLKAIELLRRNGRGAPTIWEILDALWKTSSDLFRSRSEFEEFWNFARLGIQLKRLKIKNVRNSKEGFRRYIIEDFSLP